MPDIWVDEKMLYQYQTPITLDDKRQRYMLTYDEPFDPFEYVEDFIPDVKYILQPEST